MASSLVSTSKIPTVVRSGGANTAFPFASIVGRSTPGIPPLVPTHHQQSRNFGAIMWNVPLIKFNPSKMKGISVTQPGRVYTTGYPHPQKIDPDKVNKGLGFGFCE